MKDAHWEGPTPPHNVDAEQALLGAIMISSRAYAAVAETLRPEHFYDPLHAQIYGLAADLFAADKPVTPVTLKDYLDQSIKVRDMTTPQYLARLVVTATTLSEAANYGQTIYDHAMRRQIISLSNDVTARAFEAEINDTPMTQVEGAMEALYALPVDQGPVDALQGRNRARFLHEAGVELMTSLQSKEPDDVMTTGLADLDDVLGGYYVGDLVIGAGRPSMGKSTFVTSTMMRSARHGAVLLFTLEMSAESVTARCASDISYTSGDGIAYARMMPGKRRGLSGHELERIAVATDLFQSFPVVIDERGGLSVAQIRARATREAQRLSVKGHRLRLVIVDHLGLVNAGDRSSGNRAVDLGEMTSAFKAMAKDLGVTVLLLSQLNRGVEQRDDKVPKLSDLRDSGRIEEDADSIFTFYREAYYLSRETGGSTDEALAREDQLRAVANDLDIHVVKNRHGRIGTVKAWVDMACAAVRDYPRPGEHERRE